MIKYVTNDEGKIIGIDLNTVSMIKASDYTNEVPNVLYLYSDDEEKPEVMLTGQEAAWVFDMIQERLVD